MTVSSGSGGGVNPNVVTPEITTKVAENKTEVKAQAQTEEKKTGTQVGDRNRNQPIISQDAAQAAKLRAQGQIISAEKQEQRSSGLTPEMLSKIIADAEKKQNHGLAGGTFEGLMKFAAAANTNSSGKTSNITTKDDKTLDDSLDLPEDLQEVADLIRVTARG